MLRKSRLGSKNFAWLVGIKSHAEASIASKQGIEEGEYSYDLVMIWL